MCSIAADSMILNSMYAYAPEWILGDKHARNYPKKIPATSTYIKYDAYPRTFYEPLCSTYEHEHLQSIAVGEKTGINGKWQQQAKNDTHDALRHVHTYTVTTHITILICAQASST